MNGEMTLESARQVLDLSVFELWVEYFALGGLSDAPTLDAYLRGDKSATDVDHNLIAQALNETFAERHQNSPVPYRST
jgi:hypothetical protein